jgi:3'-5' exoribonuclease
MPGPTLPPVRELRSDAHGWAFYLCVAKELRTSRQGEFLSLTLQDATGRVTARVFDDVENQKGEFEAGEFVKAQGRTNVYNGRLQLVVDRIRRVHADQDRPSGFREEDLVMSAPRPIDDMWADLQGIVAGVTDPHVRALLQHLTSTNEAQLRVWPAAQLVHHAYRGGFLEHILQIARVGTLLADAYQANRDVVVAGAILHDIGKLQELRYETATSYSREGNLIGHIALGLVMVREAAARIPGFPDALRAEVEHIVVSHHGSLEFGSPVQPMTIEAFILSAVDDLDATLNQIRQAIAEDSAEGEFTAYHHRLGRVLFKGARG